jgi:RNA polymerase sigma factor (sigma-70 family)
VVHEQDKRKHTINSVDKEVQFKSIYEQHYDKIFRLCRGYFSGDEALAADAVQEIFIKIWQHLDGFRNQSSVSTWVYRISVNTCLLYLRKPSHKKEIKTAILPERAAEAYDSIQEQRLQKMYACIQQLDETGRMIILMVLEGLEYAAIAAVVGTTEDTLRVKIHRIKKSLSNCVQL